jgi:hypothetical protein
VACALAAVDVQDLAGDEDRATVRAVIEALTANRGALGLGDDTV